jgi:predicted MFS family arabinose efflux permease
MPHRFRRAVATGSVLCGLVVAAFEGTVVTSAMPTIARELGGMAAYSWVFSAFLMATMVGVLACGKLADVLGRKPVFIGGVALFLIGSALCGASMTIGQLIAFRVIQGLGAGAIQPIAMTISADLYTLVERANVQAVFTSAWGIANVIGPILGGFIVLHMSWRWVFLVNVPPGMLAVALLVPSYRDPPRQPRASSGVVPALVAELRVLLRNTVVRAGLVAGVSSGATLYLCAAYVPLWLTTHAHLDALASGAALVPLLAGWAVGSSFGVRVLVRYGMRASVAGGFAIAFVGALALAVVGAHDAPVAWTYVALGVLGIGLGPASSTSLVAPQSAVPWQQRGLVTSAIYAARMLGGSLAVTAFGARDTSGATRLAGVALITFAAAVTAWFLAPRGASAIGGSSAAHAPDGAVRVLGHE